MRNVRQSIARNVMVFMADSADHITGKTGLTLTITASKNGAAFASTTPTVTERGNGWYSLALSTTDTNTLGDLVIRCTGTGADSAEVLIQVVAYDFTDTVRLGLTALPNAVAAASGGLFTRGTGAGQINQDANGRVNVNVTGWNGTNVPTPHTAGYPIVTHKVGTGTGEVNIASGITPANVTQWSGTNVPAPNTAGYPIVTNKVGTGTGELSLTSGVISSNVTQWSGSAVAAVDTAGHPKVTVKSGTGTGEISLSSGGMFLATHLYHADIQFIRDEANLTDEWTVTWFKNGVRLTSGVTSPTLQLVKRADGTNLKAATAMTEIGTTETFKLDLLTTDRVSAGEAVLAIAAATIDSGSQTFSRLIGRDST